jgi:hypothetical protein
MMPSAMRRPARETLLEEDMWYRVLKKIKSRTALGNRRKKQPVTKNLYKIFIPFTVFY